MKHTPRASRWIALTLVASLALPTVAFTAGCGSKDNGNPTVQTDNGNATTPQPNAQPPKTGLTTKQKVVLVAGAALLIYLYKRYKTQDAAAAAQGGAKPQLYREEIGPNKGAIYYRKNDAAHTVVWLSAPAQGVQVPADEVQKYLPGYDPNNNNSGAYQGQVNTNPQPGVNGGTVQTADQYAGSSQ